MNALSFSKFPISSSWRIPCVPIERAQATCPSSSVANVHVLRLASVCSLDLAPQLKSTAQHAARSSLRTPNFQALFMSSPSSYELTAKARHAPRDRLIATVVDMELLVDDSDVTLSAL